MSIKKNVIPAKAGIYKDSNTKQIFR